MTDQINIFDKLRCLERELRMRRQCYPGFIARGRMDEKQARREIAVLEAIIADYRELSREQQLI